MPRIARVCAVAYPHHITQRGNNKETVFFDDEDRQFYLDTLKFYSQKCGLGIWAYCLLTNHVHILAVPRQDISMSRGIGGANLVYTQYINRKYGRSGRLWQNRFFSTVVDKEAYLWSVSRYIESNPVRAGLVRSAQRYRWSSCKGHVSGRVDPVLSNPGWLEANEAEAYKEFLRVKDKFNEVEEIYPQYKKTDKYLSKIDPDYLPKLQIIDEYQHCPSLTTYMSMCTPLPEGSYGA